MFTFDNLTIMSKLLNEAVSAQMIDKMTKLVTKSIRLAPQTKDSLQIPYLAYFIGSLANGSRISSAVFYIAMIYINRLSQKLPSTALGMACTGHRIALAAIIIAEKVVCDIPLKNCAWKLHASVFTLAEINLMERQLLELLDYRIDFQPNELFNLVLEDQSLKMQNQLQQQPPIPVPLAYIKGIYHPPLAPSRYYVPESDRGIPWKTTRPPNHNQTIRMIKKPLLKYNNFM